MASEDEREYDYDDYDNQEEYDYISDEKDEDIDDGDGDIDSTTLSEELGVPSEFIEDLGERDKLDADSKNLTFLQSQQQSLGIGESGDIKDEYSNYIIKMKKVYKEMYNGDMKDSHPVKDILLKKIPQKKLVFYNPFLLILGYALFVQHPNSITRNSLDMFEKDLNSKIKSMIKYVTTLHDKKKYVTYRYDIVRYYNIIQEIMMKS